jgi:hypothetical protein
MRGRIGQWFVLVLPGLNPGGEQSEQVDVLAVVRAGHVVADVVQERVCGFVLGGCGDRLEVRPCDGVECLPTLEDDFRADDFRRVSATGLKLEQVRAIKTGLRWRITIAPS